MNGDGNVDHTRLHLTSDFVHHPLLEHHRETLKKLKARLGHICKDSHSVTTTSSTILNIYKAYMRPVVEYGLPVTSDIRNFLLDQYQILQNIAIRMALKLLRSTCKYPALTSQITNSQRENK